jgi:hypothetical protein
VNEPLKIESSLVHLLEVVGEVLQAVTGRVLDQDFRIAHDRSCRRAEVLADMGKERDLEEALGIRILRVGHRPFCLPRQC